ncbi:hypothetical protein QQX10_08690 [Demequina sp. SYSU T00039]|uniref:LPXTG-motif cell wall anchor domain-containing protein n=1 Tax=Demequina lignilytica TaxID=3051663 RepID=A0AAW7M5J9_9MICO|nr:MULTISPECIES: hypothetical protein [unclassified Demequina]MDN4477406.1 hypothetical protein [Demequina sp. SYSU T00039-1]MDN4488243.1 hypothetical protein [Demequina sp. SYSU T00039]
MSTGRFEGTRGRHARRRTSRPVIAGVSITALLATTLAGGVAAPAVATSAAFTPQTAFVIDADTAGPNDFDALYGAGTTPGGLPTTGVYAMSEDPDLCADVNDDAGDSGVKLEHGPIWGSTFSQVTPSKSDLAYVAIAAEKVDVGGDVNDIVYAIYKRCNADPGSMIGALYFDDGDGLPPTSDPDGDYLMLFEFNPSKASNADLYQRVGGTWVLRSILAGAVEVTATQTAGEVAMNLSLLRILPSDQCRTVSVGGQAATASGYDPNSALKDLAYVPPIDISNCGTVEIDKTATTDAPGQQFDYRIERTGGGTVRDGEAVIVGDLAVGEQDSWNRVINGTDYTAWELTDSLPPGWSLDTVMCTYQDIFAAGRPWVDVTLYEDGAPTGNVFDVPSSLLGGTSSCTIHNVFTGIVVKKAGDGDTGTDFDFSYGQTDFGLKLGESQTFAATAGEPVVISEGTLPASALPWGLDSIYCEADGQEVGTVDLANQKVTVTAQNGDLITCTFTNEQQGKLIVQKASDGGAGDFDITGTAAGTITTTATGGTVSGNTLSALVDAGSGYSVGEDVPDGWRLDSIMCDQGEDDPADITVNAGETVTCTVHNTKLARLSLTKEVTGVADDYPWSFGFTLSPDAVPAGTQTLAGTGNQTSPSVASWMDLQPGTEYTLSESGATGYDATMKCYDQAQTELPDADGDTPGYQIDPAPGAVIDCHVVNAAKPADVELTKTVTGVAGSYAWEFDFTLTPPATGGGLQKAAGVGDGSDVLTWTDLVPGETYTIAEEVDGDYTQALSCTVAEDLDQDPTNASVTFVASLDQHVTCAATNAAEASTLTLTKTVSGVDDALAWGFDFTLSPDATGGGMQTATGTGDMVSAPLVWSDLVPGTLYTLTEAADGDYTQTLRCTGVVDLDPSPTVVSFIAGFDQSIVCSAVNTAKPSDLTLTKTVDGVASDLPWQFGFTLTPLGGAPDAQLALGTGDGSDVLEWTGLVPGTTYIVSEAVVGGYVQDLQCTGVEDLDPFDHSVTFVAGFDQHIVCTADNTAKPTDITVTKTVVGVAEDYSWQFGFLLTPIGGLPSAQVALGTGSTSDVLTWTGLTPGMTYVLAEVVDTNYTQTLQCTGVEDLDQSDTTVTFVAGFDQHLTCDALNKAKISRATLSKEVTGVADDYEWAFAFTFAPTGPSSRSSEQFVLGGTGSTLIQPRAIEGLIPGEVYRLEEVALGGFLQRLVCDGVTDLDLSESSVTFMAGFDQSIVCRAVNDAVPTSVTVTKVVEGVADDYAWDFGFILSPEATGGGVQHATGTGPGSDVLTWEDLIPGEEYTLAEEILPGYDQTLVCDVPADLDDNPTTVTWRHGVNQNITCTATNTARSSELTVTKTVSGVADDYAWDFGFLLSPEATGGGEQHATGTGPGSDVLTWEDLIPGETYVIAEELVTGYDQMLMCTGVEDLDQSDTTVTFVAGFDQDIACDATNDALPSSLTVTKTVTNVGPDHQWDFGFLLSPEATGGGVQHATGTGPGSDVLTWEDLVPGETYVIAEELVTGYDQMLMCMGVEDLDQSDTTVTFVAGFDQDIICDATNDALPSSLTLTKEVTGVADTLAWAFDFTLTPEVGDGGLQTATGTGDMVSAPLVWEDLVPGTEYTVMEGLYPDYDGMLVCTGVEDTDPDPTVVTFIAGFDLDITCVASNAGLPSDLSVTKTVEGVADGYDWSFAFTLTPAAGGGGEQVASGTGDGTAAPLLWTDLVPGVEYVLAEAVDAGYTQSLMCEGVEDLDDVDTSVTFVAGFDQSIVCDAVNTALPSSVSITKTVTGVAEDLPWSFLFSIAPAVGDVDSQLVEGVGNVTAEPVGWTGLVPGETYTVAEAEVDGYAATLMCEGVQDLDDVASSVTFVAGFDQQVDCTATNAGLAAQLALTKTVAGMPDDGDWAFEFTLTSDVGPATVTLTGAGNSSSDTATWDLIPGATYTVSEPVDELYTQELTCTGVEDLDDVATSVTFVAPLGGMVTCDAVNTVIPVIVVEPTEPPALSVTGADVRGTLGAAALLLVAGLALLTVRRRRES